MSLELEFVLKDGATVGIKRLQKELGLLDPKIKQVDKGMLGLNSSIAKLAVGYISLQGAMNLGSSLSRQADEFKNMESQLRLVTSSTQELTRTQKELFELAQNSRQDLGATTNLYARLARASQDLGTSQKDLLQVTDTINKALVVSGASTQEASSAITQLSQGLASGVLRGEEFNSITENGSRIARALADSLGVTIGELRAMAQEGKLTSEVVINALKGQANSINKEFSQMEMTIGQAMTTVSTSIISTIGSLDKATGSSKLFAEELRGFSTIMDDNQDSIRNFAFFTFATVDRMVDGFDLLQESAELGIESLIAVPQIGLQSFIAVIYEQIFDLQEMANKASSALGRGNFFSEDELTNTLVSANIALDKSSQIVSSLKVESKEVTDSFNDWNITVDERVAKYNEEYQALLNNGEQIKKNNELSKPKDPYALTSDQTKAFDKEGARLALDLIKEKMALNQASYDLEVLQEQEKANLILTAMELTKSEQDIVNEKYMAMHELVKGIFNEDEMGSFFEAWQENIEKTQEKQEEYEGIGSRAWTAGLKGQAKGLANIGNAFEDIGDEQKKWNKFSKENVATEADKNKHLQSQLGTYGNLAGAISNTFEQGSTGAKAFAIAQQGLAIATGAVSIMSAGAGGDPYTVVPRMIAAAATVAAILGSSSGGGSVAPTPTTPRGEDYYSDLTETSEQTNKPILDKFDRQIELLEEISGYGGTSLGFSLDKALAEYTAQTQLDIINASEMGAASGSRLVHASIVGSVAQSGASSLVNLFSEEFQDNIFSWFATARPEASGVASNTHATALYGATIDATNTSVNEFIDILNYMDSNNLLDTFGYTQIEYENILSDFQNATNEFVTSLLSDIGTLIDFSDDLKDAFDEMTGTTKYEDIALSDAFEDVNALIGDSSLSNYIEEQISNIDALEESLSDADIALLLSSDIEDFKSQQDLIAKIQEDALVTLGVGVIDALNYKDSILLVSEALAESAENARDFQNAIAGMIESIDSTIISIKGNTQTQEEFTDDEIRRLNLTQRAFETSLATSDTESAQELLNEITSLSSSISNSAFGDTSLLDKNLISNLEATKALISFEDEVLNVNIVSSELLEPVTSSVTSPSVTISNPTNDSERLDNMEAILTQVLITNKNVYDLLLRIENDGIKTI